MGDNEQFKIQEILASVREEVGNDPVMTRKTISLHILQLEKKAE
jgi:hypothetical protein